MMIRALFSQHMAATAVYDLPDLFRSSWGVRGLCRAQGREVQGGEDFLLPLIQI